jgi:hypothetical protein
VVNCPYGKTVKRRYATPWSLAIYGRLFSASRHFSGEKFFKKQLDSRKLIPYTREMSNTIRVQGRDLSPTDIDEIKKKIDAHPDWHRTRLSREICAEWEWKDEVGRIKDMACRTMLLKLERRGLLTLPAARGPNVNHSRGKIFQPVLHDTSTIKTALRTLQPLFLIRADNGAEAVLWQTLLSQYHYLGFTTRVGHSLSYLVQACNGRTVACLLFGAAAWKTAARDCYIGWTPKQRQRNVSRVVNNMRFLIPPWVQVPHLAGHVLALALRRLPTDWKSKYGFSPVLVETFVEQERFKGTCYKATNWRYVGTTTGRSRQDRNHKIQVPIKDVYLYPLCREFKKTLCAED